MVIIATDQSAATELAVLLVLVLLVLLVLLCTLP
jgi:hypothetical protein